MSESIERSDIKKKEKKIKETEQEEAVGYIYIYAIKEATKDFMHQNHLRRKKNS
jgi:hypothetical protein